MNNLAKIVLLKSAPGHDDALGLALSEVAALSRQEAGCLGYDLFRGQNQSWIVVESWRDEHAFIEHNLASYVVQLISKFNVLLDAEPHVISCVPVLIAPNQV